MGIIERLRNFFTGFGDNWAAYILQFILFVAVFYYVFKILKVYKGGKFIAVVTAFRRFKRRLRLRFQITSLRKF